MNKSSCERKMAWYNFTYVIVLPQDSISNRREWTTADTTSSTTATHLMALDQTKLELYDLELDLYALDQDEAPME
jgi:hypothetical protein